MRIESTNDFSVPCPGLVRTTGVHIELIDSVQTMMVGERPFWGFMYTFNPYEHYPYVETLRSMYAQGVRLFSFPLPLPIAWDQPGGYDFSLLDVLHDQIFEIAPEGLVMPRAFMTTPHWWDDQNPDELIGFRGPRPDTPRSRHKDQPLWRYASKMHRSTKNPSLASQKWRKDASHALAAYVKHTWKKYPGHFLGYQVAYGTCGEWIAFGSFFDDRYGSYDFSRPMLRSFRSFLRRKYRTDDDLREAWNKPDVQLDTAEPPTKIQMHHTDVGVFKYPRNCRHYADWVEHYSNQRHETILSFCRVAKQAAPVDILCGAFAGYLLQVGCSAYISQLAQTQLDQLLESRYIDFLSTPNVYENRSRGVLSSAPVQAIARKKIFFAENDVRTFLAGEAQAPFGASKDRVASLASFNRDTFYNLTQGSGHLWWYDFGKGWYLDNSFEDIVAKLVTRFNNIPPSDRFGQAEVALVLDEESLCYTEGSVSFFKLWREELNEHLPRMGAPFDVITTEDMLQRQPYKLYLFRDMFYAPDSKVKKIRDLVETANASCVWFYAAGLLGERGIDPRGVEKLTRIKMNLLNITTSQQLTVLEFDHPITRGVSAREGTAGNDDQRGVYGPMLFVEDEHAEILGHIESIEKPGMAFKGQEQRFDAWFASPLLRPKLLANLALHAGVHLCVEPGNVIFGSGRLISLASDDTKTVEFKPRVSTAAMENLLTGEMYPSRSGIAKIDLITGEPVLLRLHEKL